MPQTSDQLRADAMAIWRAGVEAVRPARLMRDAVQPDGNHLLIDGEPIELTKVGRLVVVGAGKAGAGMAIAMEEILGPQILREKQVAGWINVPADCVVETTCIHLHAARPAGVNEPTAEGAYGARQIVDLVAGLEPSDLCICLISGGGSALLPAPIEGFPLADKVDLTREIAARGGSIEQLNAVRRELSEVKGGGLARRCGAGRLYTLILSDVLGDDLATIASGPTVLRRPTPQLAIDTLAELGLSDHPAGRHAIELLTERRKAQSQGDAPHMRPELHVRNTVIGN
ncbi:MAG: glycerate-2-kinase family protein, partial [Planctomycetota bacterium]